MESLRPNAQRAKNAIILIWMVLALEIISFVSGYYQYELLQTVVNGDEISIEAASANDTRVQIIALTYLIVFIISAFTFIRWFRRAYFNLHIKALYLSHSESWTAISWFVPIINLYRPYQIMKELYHETKELLIDNGIDINPNFSTRSLGWWWALWIIINTIGQFEFRHSLKMETIDDLILNTVVSMIGNIIGIPLALITVKVIKDYSKVEPLLGEIKSDEEVTNA